MSIKNSCAIGDADLFRFLSTQSGVSFTNDISNKIYIRGMGSDKLFVLCDDFVLYNPPFKSSTYILWLGPFFLLLFALIIAVKLSRKNKQIVQDQQQDKQAHKAVKELLNKTVE